MAIDSAEKRRSVAGVACFPLGPAVTPNSSKDAEWRQQSGWSYSGISATAVSVGYAVGTLLIKPAVAVVEVLTKAAVSGKVKTLG